MMRKWLGLVPVLLVVGACSSAPPTAAPETTTLVSTAVSTQTQVATQTAISTEVTTEQHAVTVTESVQLSTASKAPKSKTLRATATLDVPAAASRVTGSSEANSIVAMLADLAVKGRAPKTGYDRDLFGSAWTDDVSVDGGHNGCDTRNDILRRDLTKLVIKPGSNGCTVLAGVLRDPYTGAPIDFTRGQGTSNDVQIDHVVALSDAWQKGAQQLSSTERQDLANDPLNLQASDGPTNASKGDGDAATWLPPNKQYRCTYVSRQVEVKAKYDLWVTAAERDAIQRVLSGCGATVPTVSSVPAPAKQAPATTQAPTTSEAPETTAAPPTTEAAEDVYYENCDAVRAADADPIHAGDPGYSHDLDGDGDGVACE